MELLKTRKTLTLTAVDLNKKELETIAGGWCCTMSMKAK